MTENNLKKPVRRPRRWAFAVALFFISPLVGEFLLGNLPVTWLWALLILAPLYGGGCLLIRETARRWALGWPGILLLALAYAVVEEAFVTQSLFNPNYVGLRLLDHGFIPALGMGSWWTVFVLGIHVIWSAATPIALVEALSGPVRREPWLGKMGLAVAALLFGLGCFATTANQLAEDPFRATAGQLVGAGVAVVVLVAAAFAVGRRSSAGRIVEAARSAPGPAALLGAGLGVGSAFMIIGGLLAGAVPAWANVLGMFIALGVGGLLLRRWTQSARWSPGSEAAFAGGVLLTYVWYGFAQMPSVGKIEPWLDALGNAAFSIAALLFLAKAWKVARAQD